MTKNRYMKDFSKSDRASIPHESSKINPTHSQYDNYMNNRKGIDKAKDTIYPYIERITKNDKANQEVVPQNRGQNSDMVVGRGLLEDSSFNLKEKQNSKVSTNYSQNNSNWQPYIEKSYQSTGAKISMQDIKLPLAKDNNINLPKSNFETTINEFVSEHNEKNKILNPIEMSYFSALADKDSCDKQGIKYEVDGKSVVFEPSQDEVDMAKFIQNTFGGNIYINPKVNFPENVESSDYLWNNQFWNKKCIGKTANSLTRAVDNALKKHKNQADYFILDISNSIIPQKVLIEQAKKIFSTKGREWVKGIMIVNKKEVVSIFIK